MNKQILWLASWYPNKIDPFDGDFIQRHARAAALFNNIHVIFVRADRQGHVTDDVAEEFQTNGNLSEHIIYFKSSDSFFGRAKSFLRWRRLFKNAIDKYIQTYGKPEILHVHVAVKAGLPAIWTRRKHKIPFVLTEHWAGFSPDAINNFRRLPFPVRLLWKRVAKRARAISTVSEYLGKLLTERFSLRNYTLIPNVVDTTLFCPMEKPDDNITRFIHISRLDYQKDPESILRAAAVLKSTHQNFHLDIFGPANQELLKFANDLDLSKYVSFRGEMPQTGLAKKVAASDALILYSRYESFGCVIIEANACGVPVIVSDLTVLHEIVTDSRNGIFVKGNDPVALAKAMEGFIQNKYVFDKRSIVKMTASKFSYEVVGKQLDDWYEHVIDRTLQ